VNDVKNRLVANALAERRGLIVSRLSRRGTRLVTPGW
jgi:hypothetical protein